MKKNELSTLVQQFANEVEKKVNEIQDVQFDKVVVYEAIINVLLQVVETIDELQEKSI